MLESHFVGNLKSKVSDVVRQWEDYRISQAGGLPYFPSEKMDDLINRITRLLIDLELVGEKKSLTSVLEKIIRNLPSSFDVWAEVEREQSRHDAYNIADFWASLRRKDADLSSKSAHDSASTGHGAFTVRKQHESSVRLVRHSGSTHTNTPVRECIHEFVSVSRPYSIVRHAGGNEHEVRGHGKVIMKIVLPNNEQTTLTMTEVNYVPTFTCNLSSWKRANLKYESRGDDEGYPILPRQASACHYYASAENQSNAIKHLNEVCGHRSVHQLQHALKSSTLKDIYGVVRFLPRKLDAADCTIELQKLLQTQMGVPTTIMRFDNGKEFINHRMMSYAKQHGIRVETTTPHTPQQNGVAERCNRTLMEMARTQLNAA
ncbi:hypothetical protein CEUSTIGMA_g12620.t1 [Chlamydomonas eustigma]|uniref:Integrase catalytic domain-containing protein n=1 Tax=Chlamydomonas eustigma TaxID=1157962 RepID=A0A250XQX3_9CHLO|nr:hypothetical protein CEUSTIGMA_g12620.t1 [Chlamydomonas eustigma]|eukprot:GAX85200.1 hypothetical protein CEUSTIGMA_g12620.t1 [Chlamydomonas eustigma]